MPIPAAALKEAFLRFDPKRPITKSDPYYVVMCDDVRGELGRNIAFKIAEWIDISNASEESYSHCLFTGHVGSGKTSEILNTQEILKDDFNYHVIYLNALTVLDPNDVYPTDLLFAIAEKLYQDVSLPGNLLKNVERWFAEVIYETSNKKEYKGLIEAGLEMEAGVPLLGKLFAKLNGQISKGGSQREVIRRQLKKNMSELLRRVNEMLNAAEKKVKSQQKTGLVLIIDELEKMIGNRLNEEKERTDVFLYINHGNLLTGLDCHLLCTVPVFLLNSQSRTVLGHNFDKIFELPVIKVKEKHSDNPWDRGIDTLIQIAQRRLEGLSGLEGLELFGDDIELLRQIAQFSGGQVRLFIHLIREVLSTCRFEHIYPVDQNVLEQVFREEMRSYDSAIFDDRFERLLNIAQTKRIKREENNLVDFDMLNLGWVLAYTNQEWWYDVIPVITRLERFRKLHIKHGHTD